jgi:hypothetical protein
MHALSPEEAIPHAVTGGRPARGGHANHDPRGISVFYFESAISQPSQSRSVWNFDHVRLGRPKNIRRFCLIHSGDLLPPKISPLILLETIYSEVFY